MGFFSKIFKRRNLDKRLEGSWNSDLQDAATIQTIGGVSMTFTEDGRLYYDIRNDDKLQRIEMIYWNSDGLLFSDQPSNPKVVSTKYEFVSHDKLILEYEGQKTIFNLS